MTKVLAFSGSSRKDSFNQMTLNAVANELSCEVTHLNLAELAIPIYNGDEETASGLPEGASSFKALITEHHALIIGCPEYNGFMTPLLINALDWATRSEDGAPDLSCFKDKVILITSASPGSLAGLRAATHLRTMLSGIGSIVLPDLFSVPAAFKSFNEEGKLIDEKMQARAAETAGRLISFVERF